MPDSDAIASTGVGARADVRLDRQLAPLSRNESEVGAPSAARADATSLRRLRSVSIEPSSSDAPLAHDVPETVETMPPSNITPAASAVRLKLLVDPDRLADFTEAAVITANARNKGARKHLRSVYYDTPERAFWANSLSLCVRQNGKSFVQTVTLERAEVSSRRTQWDVAIPTPTPDLALALPFVPEKLRATLEGASLAIIFAAETHRHQRFVDLPSGTVQIAFDQGTITAADRAQPVSEISLEQKSGAAAAVYQLALRLAEQGSLRPSLQSEAVLGFNFADDKPPAAHRPSKLKLDPAVALDDAFSIVLRDCLRHLLQSMPAAEDGRNLEGVHQLRVALRRLRAALHLMQSVGSWSKCDQLRSEARWLGQSLSAARDWDIFQTETLPVVAEGCPSIGGFAALGQIAQQQRNSAYCRIRVALCDRRCAAFVIGLGEWIETRGWRSDVAPETLGQLAEPAVQFAGRILSERHDKVLKRGRRFKSLSVEKRHSVRLLLKKLRYSADFLLPLYGDNKPARRYARELAGLQEELGCYNDMATTTGLLAGLDMQSTDGASAGAAIIGWQAHAMAGVETPLRKAWRDFTAAPTPWSRHDDA